jgi:mevalonate kinase
MPSVRGTQGILIAHLGRRQLPELPQEDAEGGGNSMTTPVEIDNALSDTKALMDRLNWRLGDMLDICAGHLRTARVSHKTLAILKRELRDYNIHTGSWKDR